MGIFDLFLIFYGKYFDEKRKFKDESIVYNVLLKINVEELKEKYFQYKICYYEIVDVFKVIMEVVSNIGYDMENFYIYYGYVYVFGVKDFQLDICL